MEKTAARPCGLRGGKGAGGMGCVGNLACTGDGPLPFIVAGVVVVAAVVLVIAFVLMRRNR